MASKATETTKALVIIVNGRFYCGKTKTGRVQTAWSLAGAKLFGTWREKDIENAERFLRIKGYRPRLAVVKLGAMES